MNKSLKLSLSLIAASVISANSHAAGFHLFQEGSVVVLGNSGAGVAAEGFDAATAMYNPAALVLLKNPEIVASGIGVVPNTQVSASVIDTTTLTIVGLPDTSTVSGGVVNEYPLGQNAFVPALHAAYPFGDSIVAALSVTAPFGLGTRYEQNTATRYAATDSKIETIDISPSVAFKVNDTFSVGVGVDVERLRVDLDQVLAFPAVNTGVFPPALSTTDYLVENNADDWGVGGHGGILISLRNGATRIGVNYSSTISFTPEGTSTTTGPGGPFVSNTLNGRVKLPNNINASLYHELNSTFAFLASVMWTEWDSINQLQLNNVALPNGTTTSTQPLNWENVWRADLGFNINVNERLKMRVGGMFDESPVPDSTRNLRLPDADRWGLSLGLQFKASDKLSFDVGYQHIFIDDAILNTYAATQTNIPANNLTITQEITVVGQTEDPAIDLFGLQMRYQFG